jgi:hypothetical protein
MSFKKYYSFKNMKSSLQLKKNIMLNSIKKNIFTKNINNKYKLILFNTTNKPVGNIKYYPADSKE